MAKNLCYALIPNKEAPYLLATGHPGTARPRFLLPLISSAFVETSQAESEEEEERKSERASKNGPSSYNVRSTRISSEGLRINNYVRQRTRTLIIRLSDY